MKARQSIGQPADEKVEVVASGGKDGIDAVAVAALDVVAAHAVLGLDVADNRLAAGEFGEVDEAIQYGIDVDRLTHRLDKSISDKLAIMLS